MYQIEIKENEAGQRLDKYLHKFMPLAASSFFYKMLRKKNITLNGKKAEGKEKLTTGDKIALFLSDETIDNFRGNKPTVSEYEHAYKQLHGIIVVYEDVDIIVMNKPAGILSQKAVPTDHSINEWMIGYLLSTGAIGEEQLSTYKPSICNRLDRNTLGLIIGAKSLAGSQEMNRLIKEREIKKFYRLIVRGTVEEEETLEGYLVKDEKANKVHLVKESTDEEAAYIKTRYYPIKKLGDKTLLEVELITGKSHQIRIHMSSIGHPLLGDYKYGDRSWNDTYKKRYQIESQMLYACRLEFGEMCAPFERLSNKIIEAPIPKEFRTLTEGIV